MFFLANRVSTVRFNVLKCSFRIVKPLFPFTDNVSEDDADIVELEGPEVFSPPRDDAAMTLQGHKESVFCVTIDPTGTYLVSGGQDHVAVVWNLQTGEIMFTSEKLEDSVTCVAFSFDGNFLAAGDMAGGVRVWLRPEDGRSWTLLRSETVADLSWLIWWQPTTIASRPKFSSAVLAAGDADGLITVWSITATSRPSAGGNKHSKYLSAGLDVAATSAIYYLPSIQTDRPKLLVLYQNSELRLWDLKTELSLASLRLVPADESTSNLTSSNPQVFCLACPQLRSSYERAAHDRDLLAVGGVGAIYVVVIKETAPADCSFSAKCIAAFDTGDCDSVEAVDFAWTHPFFAFATVGGMIGIVDTVKLRVRQKWLYTDEVSKYEVGFSAILRILLDCIDSFSWKYFPGNLAKSHEKIAIAHCNSD
ncbi:hypothetical protein P879_10952 [Paragonimus westermani]|uniref:Uncharacterized protein n=1 Tax=Paragonimus westermani TaxID=34504 RepID=A0A8T0DAK1_9TREM|nr:hypothetical protein P879_10952 [Paragonimus westermani]